MRTHTSLNAIIRAAYAFAIRSTYAAVTGACICVCMVDVVAIVVTRRAIRGDLQRGGSMLVCLCGGVRERGCVCGCASGDTHYYSDI